MIPNQWYVVLSSNQVKKRPTGLTRLGENLVFWRDRGGQLSCLRDRCVHRGVQLSKGRLVSSGHLQCPFHGFEYDTTGRVRKIPANGQNAPVPERFKVHLHPKCEAHSVRILTGTKPVRFVVLLVFSGTGGRVFSRFEKLAKRYLGFLSFVGALIWLRRNVDRAW